MTKKKTTKQNITLSFYSADYKCSGLYFEKSVVRQAIKQTLRNEGITKDVEIAVTFCSPCVIQERNKRFRDKDIPTDVLSFPMYEKEEIGSVNDSILFLGDMLISLPRTKEQATEVGNSYLRELAFLAVHSTLHLLGYDHIDPIDEEEMCEKQRKIMAEIKNYH